MTRKRFKKMCMGLGFDRDRAEGFCWLAFALFPSYAAAWDGIRLAAEKRAAEDVGPYGEEATVCE